MNATLKLPINKTILKFCIKKVENQHAYIHTNTIQKQENMVFFVCSLYYMKSIYWKCRYQFWWVYGFDYAKRLGESFIAFDSKHILTFTLIETHKSNLICNGRNTSFWCLHLEWPQSLRIKCCTCAFLTKKSHHMHPWCSNCIKNVFCLPNAMLSVAHKSIHVTLKEKNNSNSNVRFGHKLDENY